MQEPMGLIIGIGFALPAVVWVWRARRDWGDFQQRPSVVNWLGAVLVSLAISVLAFAAAFGSESKTALNLFFALFGGAVLAGIVGSTMKWLPHREARSAAIELDQPIIARRWWPTWILWTLAVLGTIAIMPLVVFVAYFLQSKDVVDDIDSALPYLLWGGLAVAVTFGAAFSGYITLLRPRIQKAEAARIRVGSTQYLNAGTDRA